MAEDILLVGSFTPSKQAAVKPPLRVVNVVDPTEAIAYFQSNHESIATVLMSGRMATMSGCDAMEEMHRVEPDMPVIISTHATEVAVVVNSIQRGAFNYIFEPNLEQDLPPLLARAVAHLEAIRENRRLHAIIGKQDTMSRFVGISASTRAVLETIEKVADSSVRVLIVGESGTGKEIAARILHEVGPRAQRPFVPVNCGALSPTLLEAELFGYRKGAFTGAAEDRTGLFEQAHEGTLFLDEIGLTDLNFQIKLLRALETGEIRRVGETTPRSIDVRILSATNESLEQAIADGRFREDLYYRLNVMTLEIDPLRRRIEDIPVLAQYFLSEFRRTYPAAPRRLGASALRCLESYEWPGNVRELRNVIERAVLLAGKDEIRASDLPEHIGREARTPTVDPSQGLNAAVTGYERELIRRALKHAGDNKALAARQLKINRTTLLAKMKRLGIK